MGLGPIGADDTMARSFETCDGGEEVQVRHILGRLTVLAAAGRFGSGTQPITDPVVIKRITRDYGAF